MSDVIQIMADAAHECAGAYHSNAASYADIVRAALSAAEAAGWRLVPVEPTRKIENMLCDSIGYDGYTRTPGTRDAARRIWRAMISAAPRAGI